MLKRLTTNIQTSQMKNEALMTYNKMKAGLKTVKSYLFMTTTTIGREFIQAQIYLRRSQLLSWIAKKLPNGAATAMIKAQATNDALTSTILLSDVMRAKLARGDKL